MQIRRSARGASGNLAAPSRASRAHAARRGSRGSRGDGLLGGRGLLGEHAAHLGRRRLGGRVDVPELGRDVRVKVVEDRARLGRAGRVEVLLDERLELRGADGVGPLDVDVRVDARREVVAVAEARWVEAGEDSDGACECECECE